MALSNKALLRVDAVNANPGTILIADETYGKKMAEAVKAETDVTIFYLNPLTRGELSDKNYYIDKMMENIKILLEKVS